MAHIGRRNQLGISFDGSVKHFIPFLSCDLQERHTPIADTQARGRRDAEGYDSVEGKKWADGRIEVVLDPDTCPYWFGLALGEIKTQPTKTHNITQAESNDPLTASIEMDDIVSGGVLFEEAVVDTLELNFADDVAKVSVDVIAKYPTGTTFTPTEQSLKYMTFRNAKVKLDTSEVKISELTLRIENEAEPIFSLGDNVIDRVVAKNFRVSGSFQLLFETEEQKDAFENLEKQKLTIELEENTNSKITIEIPRIRVDNWTKDSSIDDIVNENIDFVAEYDTSTQKTMSVVVKNSVSEYITES